MEQLSVNYSLPQITTGLKKSEIAALAQNAVESVLEDGNPSQVAEALSAMEDFVKSVRKDERLVNYVREELIKNNGKLTTASGARIELCESGISYDYSENAEWVEVEQLFNALAEKKKALEEKLRKIPAGKLLVDEETGETLIGPSKSSKSSYKVTLQK